MDSILNGEGRNDVYDKRKTNDGDGKEIVIAKLREAENLARTLLSSDQRDCCLSGIDRALGALGEPSSFEEDR
jgi:hypothetical protein